MPRRGFYFFSWFREASQSKAFGMELELPPGMTSSKRLGIAALPLFVLVLATPSWAQDEAVAGYAKNGGYVGASTLFNFSFGGETFDGVHAYQRVGGEEIVILPRFEGAHNVLRAVGGYRSGRGAFEFSYERTKHSGTFFELPTEATFHVLNFDERVYLITRNRIQPHLLLGGSIPWLKIKDGSFLDPDIGDASFRGFGVNTEAGVTVYPHPRFGISTGYRYRVMWFDSASGVSKTAAKLRPRFHESSGSVVVTGLFTF
jgi:hypothetical protein